MRSPIVAALDQTRRPMTTVSHSTTAPPLVRPSAGSSLWPHVVLGLLVLAYLPVMADYTKIVLSLPHYEFAVLLPLGAIALAVPRLRRLGPLRPGRSLLYLPWILFSAACLLLAMVIASPWLGAVSALLTLGAVIYGLGGGRLLRGLLPAWTLLMLGIRLPFKLDQTLTLGLQGHAAWAASHVLTKLGMLHVLEGNVVEVPGKRFMVEEACSGIQSLFAITACTVFFLFWTHRTWWRGVLLLLCAWAWIWVSNVARVVGVTWLATRWDIPVDDPTTWAHSLFGMAIFAVTVALIVSTDRLLLFFIPPGMFGEKPDGFITGEAETESLDLGATRFPPFAATWVSSRAVWAAFLLVAVITWLPMWTFAATEPLPVRLGVLAADDLPSEIMGWQRVAFESRQREGTSQWGEHSHLWTFRRHDQKAVISVDYPFRGWHELTVCYISDGWRIDGREVIAQEASVRGMPQDLVRAEMSKPEVSGYAHLVFTCFNERQEPIPDPGIGTAGRLKRRFQEFGRRLSTMGREGGPTGDEAPSYQIQMFLDDARPLSQQNRAQAEEFFIAVQTRLTRRLAAGETP